MNTLILCRILCQFCFHTCCPLETIYVSTIEVSSPHLNRLRRKKECCFKIGQKQNLGHVNEQISEEIMLPHNHEAIWIRQPQRHVDYPVAVNFPLNCQHASRKPFALDGLTRARPQQSARTRYWTRAHHTSPQGRE